MDNLITFILNFNSLWKYFFQELNKMTYERILGKKLKNYVVKHDLLNSKPNPETFVRYKNICDKINSRQYGKY